MPGGIVGCDAHGTPSGSLGLCLQRLFLRDGDTVLIADLSAENMDWVRSHTGCRSLTPVARDTLLAMIEARHSAALLDEAVHGLGRRFPALSAQTVVTREQGIVFCLAAVLALIALALSPGHTVELLVTLLSLAFAASGIFRALLALLGAKRAAPPLGARPRTLPSYTVMVPLYREAAVVPDLIRSLRALDYPPALLDLKLVVEADDAETIAAAEAVRAFAGFDIIRVPPGGPRTKPKAANYALAFARGEYLVIYDAEDRPEPDQLLKAVSLFRASPRNTACLQARLSIHNAEHNWLTRMFALDYDLWFGALLPGLDRIGVPMPLGGTSNHFRTAVLRDIGGWDAFNVTEDADIGIRLSQLGYRVSMLDSATHEEAPILLDVWLRQRSRWLKGYMQTWLVHMRDPLALLRRTGLSGFIAFQLFIGGGVIFALANPLLWLALATAFLWQAWTGGGPGMAVPGAGLFVSNVLLTYMAVLAPRRQGWEALAPYGLTVIAYWGLVSAAGYRAAWQLVTRPFYWEKTMHGLAVPK
ncbi:MAG TPA: glycosyltransferase [Rhizomicrobium sp.]|nr:glycosyltransferase [Rhizomicrobium sp.]